MSRDLVDVGIMVAAITLAFLVGWTHGRDTLRATQCDEATGGR